MVQFASYFRHVLCKTRLIFPRINGPIVDMVIRLKENSKDISSNLCPLGRPEEGYWLSLADITDQDFTQRVYLCIRTNLLGWQENLLAVGILLI